MLSDDVIYVMLFCVGALPPSQMLEGSTARISMQDLFRIWKGKMMIHKAE